MADKPTSPFAGLDKALLRSTRQSPPAPPKQKEQQHNEAAQEGVAPQPQENSPVPVVHNHTTSKPVIRKTPLVAQKKIEKRVVNKGIKRKLGAYFTKSERQVLDDIEYTLNRGERIIGQSEILALSVETLAKILQGKSFSSIEKLRDYIDSRIVKGKDV